MTHNDNLLAVVVAAVAVAVIVVAVAGCGDVVVVVHGVRVSFYNRVSNNKSIAQIFPFHDRSVHRPSRQAGSAIFNAQHRDVILYKCTT